jgi:hypothetical protein
VNKDVENLTKKNQRNKQTNKKTKMEGHYSRLEQVEDRLSELKNEIEINEKNRRNLSQTAQEL